MTLITAVLNERRGVSYRAFFRMNTVSGAFAVDFPDLPGCTSEGDDFVQARDHAKHALDDWMDASLRRGETAPAAMSREAPLPAAHTVWIAARSGFEQRKVLTPRQTS